jgi:hypothetical protein
MLRRLIAVAAVVLAACGDSTEPSPEPDPVLFQSPLLGTTGAELFFGAYIDHRPSQPRDYQCGPKAYSGHQGVDILLRNFKVQDSGVTVVAAAAGQVVSAANGFPDRNTVNGSGGFGNHVVIDHGRATSTIYGHLKRESVTVGIGETVLAGQRLGQVGSSGNSNWPHLHFELRISGFTVDPFAGPCNPGATSLWQTQPAYHDGFAVLQAGVSDRQEVSYADLLEVLPPVDTLRSDLTTLYYWLELFNIQAESVRVELKAPDGSVNQSFAGGRATTFSATFLVFRFPLIGLVTMEGLWRLELSQKPLEGGGPMALAHTQSFYLKPAPIAAAPRFQAGARVPTLERWADARDDR